MASKVTNFPLAMCGMADGTFDSRCICTVPLSVAVCWTQATSGRAWTDAVLVLHCPRNKRLAGAAT